MNKFITTKFLFSFLITLISFSSLANGEAKKSRASTTRDVYDVPASQTDLPENENLIRNIKDQYGPIVNPIEYTALHGVLARIFDDLSKAQGRLTEGSAATVNYVHIIDSSQVNAFVWTDNKTGVRLFQNHLFLTTEIIRFMMKDVSPERGLLRLAGVMAHELGHPMDQTSAYEGEGGMAINDHYGQEASQAQEIRADIDAMRILREANYPIDSLYISLVHLFGKEPGGESLLGSLTSTHPHHDFRLTSARLFLTLDRLEKGILQTNGIAVIPEELQNEFNQELKKLIPKLGRYPFKAPTTLEEIARRINALIEDESLGKSYRELEFNRLILSFDRFLMEKQQKKIALTRSESEALKAFVTAVYGATSKQEYDSNHLSIYEPTEIRSRINKTTGVSGLENSPSHFFYLDRIEAYGHPEIREFLVREGDISLTATAFDEKYNLEMKNPLLAAASIASPDLFFELLGEKLMGLLKRVWTTKRDKGYSDSLLHDLSKLGFKFQSKLTQFTQPIREAYHLAPYSLRPYFEGIEPLWNPIPIVRNHREKNQSPILMKYRQALVYLRSGRHPELKNDVDRIRQISQDIWDRRGFYGTSEILFQENMIDWTLIFEVLGLQRQVALNQIESEVQKYMRNERQYADVPSYSQFLFIGSPGTRLDSKGLESWLLWNSRNLKNSIVSSVLPDEKSAVRPGPQTQRQSREMLKYSATQSQQIADLYRIKQKKIFVRDYQKAMEAPLKNEAVSVQQRLLDIASAHSQFFNNNPSYQGEIQAWDSTHFVKQQIDLIDGSNLSNEDKQQLFEAFFLKKQYFTSGGSQTNWDEFYGKLHSNSSALDTIANTKINGRIIEVHKKLYGGDAVDFFLAVKRSAQDQSIEDSIYFKTLDAGEKYLQPDIKARKIKSFKELKVLISLTKPLQHRKAIYEKSLAEQDYTEPESLADAETVQMNSARIQRLKKTILDKSINLKLSTAQKWQLFVELTESGPTKDTDKLFLSIVDIKTMDEETLVKVLTYLEEGRFSSDNLRLDLAKIYIGGRVDRLKTTVIEKGQKVDRYRLDRLLKDLNKFTPNGSMAKDDFLESIAWSLRLRGSELDGFIDDQKSQNWRKANPMLIRVGSLLATQIAAMSFEGRLKTIEYLLDPVNKETTLFNDIFEELKKISYNDLLKKADGLLTPQKQHALKVQADRIAEVLKLKAEEAIRDSSPSERIPLFEVVLTAGQDAPLKQKDWPTNISRRYLPYQPDSVEEAMFTTFLEILPKHEHSVSLAYMLSLVNDEKSGSIAQLFEVFGTVGIKFGQLVAVWQLFGEKIAKDSEHLKNNAKAMTRANVIRLSQSRHHEVQAIIEEFEKILGSASIKTSTRVRFKDGKLGVLALKGEHVNEIVAMNIELGKLYIERLKEKNVIKNSRFMMNLIEALEEQLAAELDMKDEAHKTKVANEILKKLNRDLDDELQGWTLKAPEVLDGKPLTSEMAFYELGLGVPFDKLSPELKSEVGPMIVKAKLAMLFQYGYFDPDRHTGNFLVDASKKTIYFLDWGQLEKFEKFLNPFTVESGLVIGKFIEGLNNLDADQVLKYAKQMAKDESEKSIEEDALKTALETLFGRAKQKGSIDIKQLMVDAINEIAESGLKFQTRYIFGGLKGLIMLFGEKYVDENTFKNILTQELTGLFLREMPAILMESFDEPQPTSKRPLSRRQQCIKALSSAH